MEALYFKVADNCFAIKSPLSKQIKKFLPSYAPFYLPTPKFPIILEVEVVDGMINTDPDGEELGQFDCGGTNHGVYHLANNGYKFIISTLSNNIASAMVTNADFSHCKISLFGSEADKSFGLGNAMMIAFAFAAAKYNTLLMHASVIMNNGKGYLFLGKSGTGKSTHTALWKKYIKDSELLNDDNPAIRVASDGQINVYGTPWSGKTPCYRNLRTEIGAIVRLEQFPTNIIQREIKIQAFASILSSCSAMIWDTSSYNKIIDTVEKVASCTPVYYLKCRPDEEAARLSYETIAI